MNQYRPSFWNSIPPVVRNLLAINLLLWLADLMLPRILQTTFPNFNLTDILGMHYWASSKFNPLQMLTYMFMHGGLDHIFFNMFAVYMFGITLEQRWGSRRFLFYYLVTGFGAGIIQQLMWSMEYAPLLSAISRAVAEDSGISLLPYEVELRRMLSFGNLAALDAPALLHMKQLIADSPLTIGASGAVFGLLLAFGWLFPEARMMLIFVPVPIKARVFVALYAVAELFLGVANFSGDNVAHFAHLGGMIFGWLLILYWKRKGKLY